MTGWQWFGTLVGFLLYIILLIFLFYYEPFEELFNLVIHGISYDSTIFWVALLIGIVGFCGFHWRAYRLYEVQQQAVESMVLASLRGSTFTAILLSAGATLQAVQILCLHLLRAESVLNAGLGQRLAAVVMLAILTGIFCIIFWLLKLVRPVGQS
jgi:hypothetical protein